MLIKMGRLSFYIALFAACAFFTGECGNIPKKSNDHHENILPKKSGDAEISDPSVKKLNKEMLSREAQSERVSKNYNINMVNHKEPLFLDKAIKLKKPILNGQQGKQQPLYDTGNPILVQQQDCLSILKNNPNARSGIHYINAGTEGRPDTISVFCDMTTAGGGWTVIQRRTGESLNFNRDYQAYADGFGLPNTDHWLGNINLSRMTRRENYQLRVDMESFNPPLSFYAEYSTFLVADACDGFRLTVEGYSGNAGDSMSLNSGERFSTYDRDQDSSFRHCSNIYQGAWWFGDCTNANLNGPYRPEGYTGEATIHWWDIFRSTLPLKSVEMKIRPLENTCTI